MFAYGKGENRMENNSKIAIIGGPGTAKSTLANNLGKELNLPIYHLDGIHHLANWVPRDKEERDNAVDVITEEV